MSFGGSGPGLGGFHTPFIKERFMANFIEEFGYVWLLETFSKVSKVVKIATSYRINLERVNFESRTHLNLYLINKVLA